MAVRASVGETHGWRKDSRYADLPRGGGRRILVSVTSAFETTVAVLRATVGQFDAPAVAIARDSLHRLRAMALRECAALVECHECLLFMRAHPTDAATLRLVEAELRRITAFLRARRGRHAVLPGNEGLPYVSTVTRYTHDFVRWLSQHPHCRVTFEGFDEPSLQLRDVLRLTLPSLERGEANAELTTDEMFEALGVPPRRRLPFLLAELGRLDHEPYVKDHLFDALGVSVRVTPTHAAFSTAYNRLPMPSVSFLPERLRHFDATALMNGALPAARVLDDASREAVVRVLRNTMALTLRETDPATYMDARSLRVFDLERGVSVAIFGMVPARQLAVESYVGFTAFRNGMPVSYGGAWMVGARANFGMNIFAPYRGGESGYVMCQLLRVYRQQFGVQYFEVEAHQFGKDNPEGIETGAFWFYYRYGFRPIDRVLAARARQEKARLAARPGARSTRRTLLAFTDSNVALNFGGPPPMSLYDVTTRVTRMVNREYAGDRPAAERACIERFVAATGMSSRLDPDERAALAELAMVAGALRVSDDRRLGLLADMVRAKPVDVYHYQRLLSAFLAK